MDLNYLAVAGACAWAIISLLPWRPWATSEALDAATDLTGEDLSDITVLEQGFRHVHTNLLLLLDADIRLKPGILWALRRKMEEGDLQLASLMAALRMVGFWERLLMPTFIYFFKMLYPFRLSNSTFPWVAAAAGGCILLRTGALRGSGGFEAVRSELIDDCALAAMVLTYLPTLRFYNLSFGWALLLPVIAMFYLAMTWTSAIRFWRGKGREWKGRSYGSRQG